MECIVKDRDADAGHMMEIFQPGTGFLQQRIYAGRTDLRCQRRYGKGGDAVGVGGGNLDVPITQDGNLCKMVYKLHRLSSIAVEDSQFYV